MEAASTRNGADRRKLHLGALDAVDAIAATTSTAGLYALLQQTFASFNIGHFIISGIPMPHERLERAVVLRAWPAGWFDMYTQNDYVRFDPTVRRCRTTTMPFEWSEAPVDPLDPRARDVMNFARDFGLLRGFSLPIHGADGSEACVSLGGRMPDLDSATKPALHLLAMYAFEKARSLAPPLAPYGCRRQVPPGYRRDHEHNGANGHGA